MLVECHPHADPSSWLLENPGFVSGGNLRWWRDQICQVERDAEARGDGDAYDLLTGPAAEVPAGAEGLIFLPCMQGAMAPEWNGSARGVFYGLTLAHSKAHMTRALLEGSAFALRDILEAMRAAGLEVRRLTIVGGGAKGALWRQIKADVTGLPVRVPSSVETTATGADSSQNRGARRGRLDAGRNAHREAGDIGFDLPPQRALRPTADDGQSPHIEAGVSHRLQDVAQREGATFE